MFINCGNIFAESILFLWSLLPLRIIASYLLNAASWLLKLDRRPELQPVAKMLRHSHEKTTFTSCFKSLLVTGPWDIILTSLLPPIQSCSAKFWTWSCTACNFEKGWTGGHKHKIMDRSFKPKYGTVSQVLLQLVVASIRSFTILLFHLKLDGRWWLRLVLVALSIAHAG